MARLLTVIESVSPIADWFCRAEGLGERRHLLLKPGIALEPGEIFRPGDSLVLKRPDGSMVSARIGGFLEVGYNKSCQGVTRWVTYDSCIAIPDLHGDEIPPGTEVWSVDPP